MLGYCRLSVVPNAYIKKEEIAHRSHQWLAIPPLETTTTTTTKYQTKASRKKGITWARVNINDIQTP